MPSPLSNKHGQPRIRDCCGGMAVTGIKLPQSNLGFGGGVPVGQALQAVNWDDDVIAGVQPGLSRRKRWPCWGHPEIQNYQGQWTGGTIRAVNEPLDLAGFVGMHLGYNMERATLVNTGGAAVYECSLARECALISVSGPPAGYSPNRLIVSGQRANELFAQSYPAGNLYNRLHSWGGATQKRLYGWNWWNEIGVEIGFKIWSVDYAGDDYRVEQILLGDAITGNTKWFPTVWMNVADTHFYYSHPTESPRLDYWIYEDGAKIVMYHTLHGGVGTIGAVGDPAFARIGSQLLMLTHGGTQALIIVEDGAEFKDQRVFFKELGGDPFSFGAWPTSIGFDDDKKCVVVTWGGGQGNGWPYITYITKPITTGNIIGQDGVFIYGGFGTVGYSPPGLLLNGFHFGPALPCSVIVPGVMPRPLTIVGGEIEEPEPPEPPGPNCDGLNECAAPLSAQVFVSGFADENSTTVGFDPTFPFGDILTEWTPGVLDDFYTMTPVPGDPNVRQIWFVPVDQLDQPILGNYNLAGRRIRRRSVVDDPNYPPPDNAREDWVYGLKIRSACSGGQVTSDVLWLETQTFQGLPGQPWPTFLGTEQVAPGLVLQQNGGTAFDCHSGQAHTEFRYEHAMRPGNPFDVDNRFSISVQLRPGG